MLRNFVLNKLYNVQQSMETDIMNPLWAGNQKLEIEVTGWSNLHEFHHCNS